MGASMSLALHTAVWLTAVPGLNEEFGPTRVNSVPYDTQLGSGDSSKSTSFTKMVLGPLSLVYAGSLSAKPFITTVLTVSSPPSWP
jgi:hypothetical protein